MIQKSGYENRVHFVFNVSDSELAFLYNGATAMIFPSSYEGFGLPILEAMACGCPVVTSNNSSLSEVGGNAALYLNTSAISDIEIVLAGFENNGFNLLELKDKSIAQATKFNWQNTAAKHIDIYKQYLEI